MAIVNRTKTLGFRCKGKDPGYELVWKWKFLTRELARLMKFWKRESTSRSLVAQTEQRSNQRSNHSWFYTGAERVNELWINSRSPLQTFIFLMSFEYIYTLQKFKYKCQTDETFFARMSIWKEVAKTICHQWFFRSLDMEYFVSFHQSISKGRTICYFKSFSLYLLQRHSVVLEALSLQKYHFKLVLFYYAEKVITVRSVAFPATVCKW